MHCYYGSAWFTYFVTFLVLKTKALLLFLIILPCIGFSQNLVKNPSFEEYKYCPLVWDFDNNVKDWYSLSNGVYFNSCAPSYSNGVPKNRWGNQLAHSGNAYASVLVYYYDFRGDFRGYIEGEFIEPLKKDTLYCVSYYVNLIDIADGAIKKRGCFY